MKHNSVKTTAQKDANCAECIEECSETSNRELNNYIFLVKFLSVVVLIMQLFCRNTRG